jgi:hypothetical protein
MVALARIFHTGSLRSAANPDAETTDGRETPVETALALGGSPERARRAGASESTKVMDCDDGCMFHTARGRLRDQRSIQQASRLP